VRELAHRSDGIVCDPAMRAFFSTAELGKLLDGWSGDIPDVRRHVTLDQYRDARRRVAHRG
jgi:hypothetical protein